MLNTTTDRDPAAAAALRKRLARTVLTPQPEPPRQPVRVAVAVLAAGVVVLWAAVALVAGIGRMP